MGRKSQEDNIRRTKKTKAKEKKNRNGYYNQKHVRQIEKVIEKRNKEKEIYKNMKKKDINY